MSFANFKPGFALAALLLQGALGNPVSTYAGTYDTTTVSPSPTSVSEVTRGACDATLKPYGCSSSATCSRSICVDNINECGMMYGGCFLDPVCTGGTAWPTFSKPPCPTTTSFISSSSACTQSICQDFINECGQTYGGCFLDPKCTGGTAFPTFVKPPCPTTTSVITSSACTQSICADYINSCGQTYGGCFLDPKCTGGSTYPTFTPPPCASPTSKSSSQSQACTRSICVDNVNECGIAYGGCFLDPQCTGGSVWPTFTKPSCPTGSSSTPCTTSASSLTVHTSSTAKATCSHSICIDGVDECGQGWGGCFLAPECGGQAEPSFTKPYCVPTVSPTAVIIETVTRYTSNPLVTVTSTSTSKYYISTVSGVSSTTNSTRISTPSPTQSPPAPVFTGSAVRNVAGFGVLAAAVAAGALFL